MVENRFIETLYVYIKHISQKCIEESVSPEIYLHVPREAKFPYIHVEIEEINDFWEGPIKSKSCICFSLTHFSSSLGPQEIVQMVKYLREFLDGKVLGLTDSYEAIIKHIIEKNTVGCQKGLYKAQDSYKALIRVR